MPHATSPTGPTLANVTKALKEMDLTAQPTSTLEIQPPLLRKTHVPRATQSPKSVGPTALSVTVRPVTFIQAAKEVSATKSWSTTVRKALATKMPFALTFQARALTCAFVTKAGEEAVILDDVRTLMSAKKNLTTALKDPPASTSQEPSPVSQKLGSSN